MKYGYVFLQCTGEGVCNGAVQPESGHPRLQGAPEGLPRPDQGECPEETLNTCTRAARCGKETVIFQTPFWKSDSHRLLDTRGVTLIYFH